MIIKFLMVNSGIFPLSIANDQLSYFPGGLGLRKESQRARSKKGSIRTRSEARAGEVPEPLQLAVSEMCV